MNSQTNLLVSEELNNYKPTLKHKPADFETFWKSQKNELTKIKPDVTVTDRKYSVPGVEVKDIVFNSWDGTPITGLFMKPRGVKACPVIISYHGYTSSCGLPIDYLKWTSLGIAVFAFDVRGQGVSPDYAAYPNGSRIPGWMLHGITGPTNYYYTNVYKDLLLQLNWVRTNDLVEITQLGLVGSSQGGGLALSIGGMVNDIDFICADYPFGTHYERALKDAQTGPYMELIDYFKLHDPQYDTYDTVLQTLSYVDSLHFCPNITCPVLMSIGLKDSTTPPATAFAAYNHLQTNDKRIEVYPNFVHEVNPFHEEKKLQFVMEQLR